MRRLAITAAAVITVLVAGAGSCDDRGLGDAPVGRTLEEPRTVIVMPDTFPNLVVACDGPARIYVTTRNAPPVVVANHPACAGAERIDQR